VVVIRARAREIRLLGGRGIFGEEILRGRVEERVSVMMSGLKSALTEGSARHESGGLCVCVCACVCVCVCWCVCT
jgi:hypothetical protein